MLMLIEWYKYKYGTVIVPEKCRSSFPVRMGITFEKVYKMCCNVQCRGGSNVRLWYDEDEVAWYLPTLAVVAAECFPCEVLVPTVRINITIIVVHVRLLGILLQVRNVVGSVASLEHCVGGR